MPLYRRIPKRGFTNPFRKEYAVVNVAELGRFDKGATVTPESLVESGIVRKIRAGVKILGNGSLEIALTVQAHRFSARAVEKIEKAGGKAEVIGAA